MVLVLALAGVIWFGGQLAGLSGAKRGALLGILFLIVLLLQIGLPDGHGLRAATGGSAELWLLLAGAAALVWLYRLGLAALRRRAQSQPAPPQGTFTATELDRYARHIVLHDIGGPGQKRLKQARVLVIGAGGLGSPALIYLAAAGVGTIGIVDDDVVDNSNLQRQVIHRDADIGRPKVLSAADAMQAQNPKVTVNPYRRRLDEDIAADLFPAYDVILDGTDNFSTRYLVNRAAVAAGRPLVSGALGQWEGQISVFDPARDAPCYRCIFPQAPAPEQAPACSAAGVLGPLPGVIGTMMAVETIKLITGAGAPLRGQMLIYDALWGETRRIGLKRRADCPDCGTERTTG